MCSGGAMIVSLAIRRLDHAPSQPGHATTLGKHLEKPPTSPARHRIGSTCRAVGGLRMPARIPAVRSGPPRRSRRPRYLAALLACALAATIVAGVGAGTETYTATTPAARVSNYQQALQLRCGLLSTALTWTTSDGRSTDLAYDVVADRVHPHVGAVRLRMTPHWNGRATVTDL